MNVKTEMNETAVQDALMDLILDGKMPALSGDARVLNAVTFKQAGVLSEKGLLIHLSDGSTFQFTINKLY